MARREDLLEEHGYSLEDLRPSYVCPELLCNTVGEKGLAGTNLPQQKQIAELILRRRSTLISSNLDIGALEDLYSDRILSRIISSYTILQFPETDIRIQKKLRIK